MAHQPLLSELCSICHINAPKYKCPGCSTRTCSLYCVRRHKDWAQCSGKRDPTAYVGKNRLATSAGIDHDYNFISGIQRSRGDAERTIENRGLASPAANSSLALKWSFQNRIALTQVSVQKAPVGMSRQKLNKTRCTKSKRLLWTVEWVHADQQTHLSELMDTVPISVGYTSIFNKLHRSESKKRKRNANAVKLADDSDMLHQYDAPRNAVYKTMGSPSVAVKSDEIKEFQEPAIEQNEEADAECTPTTVDLAEDAAQVHVDEKRAEVEDECPEGENSVPMPGSSDAIGNCFYLVKPRTTGAQKVLIPLSPTDCLLHCLRQQTVLEFPTIQVLSHIPAEISSNFILEKDYVAKIQSQ